MEPLSNTFARSRTTNWRIELIKFLYNFKLVASFMFLSDIISRLPFSLLEYKLYFKNNNKFSLLNIFHSNNFFNLSIDLFKERYWRRVNVKAIDQHTMNYNFNKLHPSDNGCQFIKKKYI